MKNFGINLVGIGAMATLMLPTSALALDAQDFADKFSLTLKSLTTLDISFGSAVANGNSIVLGDWDIEGLSGRGERLFDGTITFSNVVETADGHYEADTASFSDIDFSEEGVRLQISDVVFNDIAIFADPNADTLNTLMLYQGANTGPMSVTIEDQKVFSIDSIQSSFFPNENYSIFSGGYSIEGIYGNLSQVEDRDLEELLDVLQMDEINASMEGQSSWNVDLGHLEVQDSSLNIDNIGRLGFNMKLQGYTVSLLYELQGLNQELAEADPGEAEMLSMQVLMSMAAKVSLEELSIRFDDDSMTNKIMDFIAQEEELSRKGLISTVAQTLPMMLGKFNIPELQAEIIDAVITFLRDPQSFEISAEPEEAVPFVAMMAIAASPSIAKDLLNLSITANQPE